MPKRLAMAASLRSWYQALATDPALPRMLVPAAMNGLMVEAEPAKLDAETSCIADAKTIRETAIASAKVALEEAFTPTLMASFAEQLNELDLDTLDIYISSTYPDLRKCINLVQQSVHEDKLVQTVSPLTQYKLMEKKLLTI